MIVGEEVVGDSRGAEIREGAPTKGRRAVLEGQKFQGERAGQVRTDNLIRTDCRSR